ncbi:hypothetical protein JHN49_34175 [Streptomyces sp. MBT57]|nr:hypothetical protein [Streptomyces sp. MBT57]
MPMGADIVPYGGERAVALSNGKLMSTGEVRSLRQFTRFLAGKELETLQIGDTCKQAEAVSAHRVDEVQALIEKCRNPKVKGGTNLVGSLERLLDALSVQAQEAAQLNGNAVRGVEGLRTLNQNTEVRHGGVYKAVVDSDEISPGERAFYQR